MSEALERVKLRNDFYKDNFRRVVFILLLSILLNVVFLGSFFFFSTREPTPIYFATTQDGQLLQLSGSQEPIASDQAVLGWVSKNVPQLYQLDYVNYRTQIDHAQQYFTKLGWDQFSNSYLGIVKQVINGKFVASATLYDVPVILRSGVLGKNKSWQIQVPLLVSYQQGDKVTTQKIILQAVVQRVNNVDSTQLLGIAQVIEKTVGTGQ